MIVNKKLSSRFYYFLIISVLILVCFIMIYPFWYVLMRSLMSFGEAASQNLYFFPKDITFEGYVYVLRSKNILSSFLNSIFITVCGTLYQLILSSMAAYALTKNKLPLRGGIIIFIIITMFFGGGLIPYFLVINALNLRNSLLVMIIPAFTNVFNIIIMKTFFNNLPKEIEESATIDGAGYLKVFRTIIIPLSTPVLATIALFIAVGQWNNWFTAMIFIYDSTKFPLSYVLQNLLSNIGNESSGSQGGYVPDVALLGDTVKMSVVIVSIVPIICTYPFLQKYFVSGVTLGAVKS